MRRGIVGLIGKEYDYLEDPKDANFSPVQMKRAGGNTKFPSSVRPLKSRKYFPHKHSMRFPVSLNSSNNHSPDSHLEEESAEDFFRLIQIQIVPPEKRQPGVRDKFILLPLLMMYINQPGRDGTAEEDYDRVRQLPLS